MPEEEAFCVLVQLMKSYSFRELYTPDMMGLQLRLFQFDYLILEHVPMVHEHLTKQGVQSSVFASQW
jgi:hypothetical protein